MSARDDETKKKAMKEALEAAKRALPLHSEGPSLFNVLFSTDAGVERAEGARRRTDSTRTKQEDNIRALEKSYEAYEAANTGKERKGAEKEFYEILKYVNLEKAVYAVKSAKTDAETKRAEAELSKATDALSEGATVVPSKLGQKLSQLIESRPGDWVKSDEFDEIYDQWSSSDQEKNLALLESYVHKTPQKQSVDEIERKSGKEFHQQFDSMKKEKGKKASTPEPEIEETPETPKKKGEKPKKK